MVLQASVVEEMCAFSALDRVKGRYLIVRQLGGLPQLKDRIANPHINITIGPQEKYQFNTARPKAVNVLRSVFNFGLARDKLALNSIAVAV